MSTFEILLPDSLRHFVEEQVARGGFGSVSDYVGAVLRDVQRREARRALDARLLEALDEPAEPMTPDDWVAIEREALDRLERERREP